MSSSSPENNGNFGGGDGGSKREIGLRMRSHDGNWI